MLAQLSARAQSWIRIIRKLLAIKAGIKTAEQPLGIALGEITKGGRRRDGVEFNGILHILSSKCIKSELMCASIQVCLQAYR